MTAQVADLATMTRAAMATITAAARAAVSAAGRAGAAKVATRAVVSVAVARTLTTKFRSSDDKTECCKELAGT